MQIFGDRIERSNLMECVMHVQHKRLHKSLFSVQQKHGHGFGAMCAENERLFYISGF